MVLSWHIFLGCWLGQLAASPGTRETGHRTPGSLMAEMTRCRLVMLLLALGTGATRVRLRLQPPLAIRSDNRRIFSSHQPRSDIYLSTANYLHLVQDSQSQH